MKYLSTFAFLTSAVFYTTWICKCIGLWEHYLHKIRFVLVTTATFQVKLALLSVTEASWW